MRKIKDVIYDIIKPLNDELAEYYQANRHEMSIENDANRNVEKIIEEDYHFWLNVINNLPISDWDKYQTTYTFNLKKGRYEYTDGFETMVLPLLLKYWKPSE